MRLVAAGAHVAVCVPQCAVADVKRTLISIIQDSEGAHDMPTEPQPKILWHVWTPQTPTI
jgi:hypothetical protein